MIGHRPPLRVAYNGSMFALAALAAGARHRADPGDSVGALIARLVLAAFVYYWVVNLVLISAVLAASAGKPFFKLIWDNAKQTTAPFALMTSAALMLVVLWERSPALSMALVGPLLAIALYQRSTFAAPEGDAARAHRPAHRASATTATSTSGCSASSRRPSRTELADLCLVDIDDFKRINDTHGHPVGDRVLGQVASRLRQGGESFRLGGDEFAVLLPGLDAHEAASRRPLDRRARRRARSSSTSASSP